MTGLVKRCAKLVSNSLMALASPIKGPRVRRLVSNSRDAFPTACTTLIAFQAWEGTRIETDLFGFCFGLRRDGDCASWWGQTPSPTRQAGAGSAKLLSVSSGHPNVFTCRTRRQGSGQHLSPATTAGEWAVAGREIRASGPTRRPLGLRSPPGWPQPMVLLRRQRLRGLRQPTWHAPWT